jgi:hypothetical protein
MTLEGWVRPSALGTAWRNVLFKEQPGDMVYSLYANENTTHPVSQVYMGGAEQNAIGSSSLPLNTWSFLASTYDGATLRLYLNGSQVGSIAVSGSIPVSNGVLHIGGDSVWGEWFAGLIDNIRIYNRALSVSEIQTDMSTPVGGTTSPAPAPSGAVRVNTGGPAYTATDGRSFLADQFYSGGLTYSSTHAISGTSDPALYQNERWGQFGYSIPVANGTYDVTFHFVELYYASPCAGKRVFSMDILDTPASPDIANLDICAQVGPNAALVRTVKNVAVADGALDVKSVYGSADDPEVAAIEVTPSTAASGDSQPPTTPAGFVQTGAGASSVSVAWSASTDNVGVTGYDLYRNGAVVATTAGTSYSFSGLACGTSYAFAVDAYDAAGNRSGQASVGAATSACSGSGASVYLSASGSDANPCTQAAPCRSFDRGYHAAAPGQTVELAAGSYGDQTVTADATKTSAADVLVRPAAGAAVSAGTVTIAGAAHLELRDFGLAEWHVEQGSDDVTLRNLTAGDFFLDSASNVNVIGGSYGPATDLDDAQIRPSCAGCTPPSNVLVDGVSFHDATLSPGSTAHVECLQVAEVIGLTIRNSRFVNCEQHNVFISPWWGGPLKNVLLENNFGGRVRTGYYGFRVANGDPGEVCDNVVMRYNSATTAFLMQCASAINGTAFIANVGPYSQWTCDTSIVYGHNVWDGAACSSSDVNAPSGFVDPANSNLHLQPGAAAVDHGDPHIDPPTDIDGQARPMGNAPDAGADEEG